MSKRRSAERRRALACEFAATVLNGQFTAAPDSPIIPQAWSMVVFFEGYLERGAAGTRKDFGPKKPAKLREVKK